MVWFPPGLLGEYLCNQIFTRPGRVEVIVSGMETSRYGGMGKEQFDCVYAKLQKGGAVKQDTYGVCSRVSVSKETL